MRAIASLGQPAAPPTCRSQSVKKVAMAVLSSQRVHGRNQLGFEKDAYSAATKRDELLPRRGRAQVLGDVARLPVGPFVRHGGLDGHLHCGVARASTRANDPRDEREVPTRARDLRCWRQVSTRARDLRCGRRVSTLVDEGMGREVHGRACFRTDPDVDARLKLKLMQKRLN